MPEIPEGAILASKDPPRPDGGDSRPRPGDDAQGDPGPPNDAPIAELATTVGNVNPETAFEGAIFYLDASPSHDPDATGTLTFYWEQQSGPSAVLATPRQAITSVTAPGVDVEATLTFRVSVSDGRDGDTLAHVVRVTETCLQGGTPRALNTPAQGDLVLSEVFANPSGSDLYEEWVEIYVAADVDLNSLTVLNDAAGSISSGTVQSSACVEVATGTYLVIGTSKDPSKNGNVTVDYTVPVLILHNEAAEFRLEVGERRIDLALQPEPTSGVSSSLNPVHMTATANDAPSAWCAGTSVGVFDGSGTPGAPNDSCN